MFVSSYEFGSCIINRKSVNYSQAYRRFSIKASPFRLLSFSEISRHWMCKSLQQDKYIQVHHIHVLTKINKQ